jgi:hypothetical protein
VLGLALLACVEGTEARRIQADVNEST